MGRIALLAMTSLLLWAGWAVGETNVESALSDDANSDAEDPPTICELIEDAARQRGLPVGYFTRLIWKESRFKAEAVSPKGAQGIAQFMPGTAKIRKLADPFDPAEAIPASAHYLQDLSDKFGNLGLAAAAYNAGEGRVGRWLAGKSGLPYETRDFVLTITGLTAEEWRLSELPNVSKPDDEDNCLALSAKLSSSGAGARLVRQFDEADWAPWGVQVGGNFSLSIAMGSYGRLQALHAEILGDRPPMVMRDVNRSRGQAAFYTVRVPAETREDAVSLCEDLRRSGGACVVLKSRR